MNADQMAMKVEWDDPKGVSSPELAATWARVGIRVGGLVPTRVLDRRSQTVRDELYLPTYPLAEWIACNWHALLYERWNPARSGTSGAWRQRHCLRSGREGFAVPALEIASDGQSVRIVCRHFPSRHEPVEFLVAGQVERPVAEVRSVLASFVSLTVARLSACGIDGTRLQEEWASVQSLDEDEEAFCIAAARLGQDPFCLDDGTAVGLVNAAGLVHEDLRDDFLDMAVLSDLAGETREILGVARSVDAEEGLPNTVLAGLRGQVRGDAEWLPWKQGYAQARELRSLLGIEGARLDSLAALLHAVGLDEGQRPSSVLQFQPTRLFECLVGPSKAGSPVFVMPASRGDASQRFAFCRALSGFLESGWSLATTSHSARQKRNRAFAAELLAPAEMIRRRVKGAAVDCETTEQVALEFGVSEYVIRHQIRNHGIAELYDYCG